MPKLSLSKRPPEEELEEAINLILRQLSDDEQSDLAWFFRRNDLYNLIEFWQFQYDHLLHRPLRKPHLLKRETLKNLKPSSEQVPKYMREWYEENQDLIPYWSANRIETELHELFFGAISELPEGFIRRYFLFEKELREIMASYHQARYNFLDQDAQWLTKDLRQALHKEPPLLNQKLMLEKPYLEGLLKALASKNPATITRAVHEILWEQADALSRAHYYDYTALLNYAAKLFLLYRREQLDENKRQARLQVLVDEALSNITNHE